jgi:hypothetical protein
MTPKAGGLLNGVAATSSTSDWVVGSAYGAVPRAFILRWNGRSWMRVPSPSSGKCSGLAGVAAISAANAWAVGFSNGCARTMILHWTGHGWKRVRSPM